MDNTNASNRSGKTASKTARNAKAVVQACVVVGLGLLVRHKTATTDELAWVAAGWLLTAWVVVRLGLMLQRGVVNFRAHTAGGVNLESLDKLTVASMEPWMRGMYEVEKRCHRGFWRTLTGKPAAPGGAFSVAGGPINGKLTALLLAAVGAIATLCALSVAAPGSWRHALAVAGIAAAALYMTSWIVGARRVLKEGGHGVLAGTLALDFGIHGSGTLPLAGIAACSLIGSGPGLAGWRARNKVAAAEVWTAAPAERPNVLIELAPATALCTVAYGSARAAEKRFVALYVDQPEAFAAAVAGAMAGRQARAVA